MASPEGDRDVRRRCLRARGSGVHHRHEPRARLRDPRLAGTRGLRPLLPARRGAHPLRARPRALPPRALLDRATATHAPEDRDRLHRRAQPHARRDDARALHVRPAVAEACIALSLVLVARPRAPRAARAAAPRRRLRAGPRARFAGAMAETRCPRAASGPCSCSTSGSSSDSSPSSPPALALTRLVRWRHSEIVTAYAVGVTGRPFFLRSVAVFR